MISKKAFMLASVPLLAGLGSIEPARTALAAVPAAMQKAVAGETNWSSFGGSSDELHYSPLAQINSKNINRLGLAWYYDLDTYDSYTTPLAVDGVIYFAVGHSVLHAIDAKSGKLLWRYDPEVHKYARHKMRTGWGMRGIAYKDGKVFTGTRDGRLIAVDAKDGSLLWSVQTVDAENEAYITGPPFIAGNNVMIGFGGSDYGPLRGYVSAYNINTGDMAWRFHVVPGNPSNGFESKAMEEAAKTWSGEWWKLGGGGAVFHAMAYDAKYDRVYLGTGNGWPWNQKIRDPGGGDNLYLASIVALDAKTGEYIWHYQTNPRNTWDFNNAMDIELTTMKFDGKMRDVILHAPKNGFYYVLDRDTGKLLAADKFATATWAERIDLKTGRPVDIAEARYETKPALVYPWPQGAHGVAAMAHSPRTGLTYIPAMEAGRMHADPPDVKNWKYKPGMFINSGLGAAPMPPGVPAPSSSLIGWDVAAKKPKWTVQTSGVINGGVTATAGNLVFQGMTSGELIAYDATTGKKVWAYDAQNGILGSPISYTVGGRQYITVISGYRSTYPTTPNWDYPQQKRRVLTFVLDGNVKLPPLEMVERPVLDDPAFVVDDAKAQAGAGIYNLSCVLCHGPGAVSGNAAPDLRKSQIPLDAAAFRAVVHDGLLMSRGMPNFNILSDAELENIRHFIRKNARASLVKK